MEGMRKEGMRKSAAGSDRFSKRLAARNISTHGNTWDT